MIKKLSPDVQVMIIFALLALAQLLMILCATFMPDRYSFPTFI